MNILLQGIFNLETKVMFLPLNQRAISQNIVDEFVDPAL